MIENFSVKNFQKNSITWTKISKNIIILGPPVTKSVIHHLDQNFPSVGQKMYISWTNMFEQLMSYTSEFGLYNQVNTNHVHEIMEFQGHERGSFLKYFLNLLV